jgi:two-component system, cell cycle sensor histidine kinase and response regulator CckA
VSAEAASLASTHRGLSPRGLKFALAGLFAATALAWWTSRALLSADFLPHWYCFAGNARLLWTTVIADLLIGLSYVAISATLAWLVRRAGRDLPYSAFFWAFGLFIVSCGVTHFFEIITVWKPVYWLSAAAKIVTAAASLGTAVVLLIAADDIVDFVRTAREAASQRGNERFRALIYATPLPVMSFDLRGKVTAWNPAAERVFGWPANEVIGNTSDMVPEDKRQETAELCARTAAGEVTTNLETIRLHRDGRRISIQISTAPVFDEHGALTGLMAVLEDISERKRTELELNEKRAQQEKLEIQVRQAQKMEVLGRLAGGVAHDFNNMLMVLGGCSELLDRALPKESSARIYLDQIQRATEKASAITKQLLAFSRKQVLEFRPLDLHEALRESEFMLPRLLGSDIELTFRHAAEHSWILSDPTQIEQIVANLAVNARDAMPEGGKLEIRTRNARSVPDDGPPVDNPSAGWVVLEVADTGTGMDAKIRTRIFEPFFTTKPEGKGTGLGLATVYGIVKQGQGHIRVESAAGAGTTFEIYFRATTQPALTPATVTSPGAVVSASHSEMTILIVDDEAALRHAVSELLRSAGYRVLEADSSLEALETAHAHADRIDVLLTDIVMPGMRGPELARHVTQVHPETQIIYMSGYAENFSEVQPPADSTFLQKPFRFATLLEQLKLNGKKA